VSIFKYLRKYTFTNFELCPTSSRISRLYRPNVHDNTLSNRLILPDNNNNNNNNNNNSAHIPSVHSSEKFFFLLLRRYSAREYPSLALNAASPSVRNMVHKVHVLYIRYEQEIVSAYRLFLLTE